MAVFRPSGGLIYHWLALRSAKRWQPLVDDLQQVLSDWLPAGDQLILIGPSGGYTLPHAWLGQFREILAYDLDPLAPWFFKFRHPGLRSRFIKQDMFWRDGRLTVAPIEELLAHHPQAAILFCNILGQLPLEGEVRERDFTDFLSALRGALEGRRWASYHDTYTHEGDGQTVLDHMTSGSWASGMSKTQLEWRLKRDNRHILEVVTR